MAKTKPEATATPKPEDVEQGMQRFLHRFRQHPPEVQEEIRAAFLRFQRTQPEHTRQDNETKHVLIAASPLLNALRHAEAEALLCHVAGDLAPLSAEDVELRRAFDAAAEQVGDAVSPPVLCARLHGYKPLSSWNCALSTLTRMMVDEARRCGLDATALVRLEEHFRADAEDERSRMLALNALPVDSAFVH